MNKTSPAVVYLRFWPLQLGGWFLYFAVTAAAYVPFRHTRVMVAYRGAFLVVVFVESFALHRLCRLLQRRKTSFLTALAVCIPAAYCFGVVCSFAAMWSEYRFGGLYSAFRWEGAFSGATSGCFVLIAWATLYFSLHHFLQLQDREERLLVAERSARDAQLRALRYQIQPHFLFNTLNAISTLVLNEEPRAATQMIAKLSHLLRRTLDAPESHFVTVAQELDSVREYLAIEQIRFGAKLDVLVDVDPTVQSFSLPRFLLQPLVENAIRHGIAQCEEGGCISVSAASCGQGLSIAIHNPISPNRSISTISNQRPAGLGLTNTRSRLQECYGESFSLACKAMDGIFSIRITIPRVESAE